MTRWPTVREHRLEGLFNLLYCISSCVGLQLDLWVKSLSMYAASQHNKYTTVLWIRNWRTLLHRHQHNALCSLTRWQHFVELNVGVAAMLKMRRQIEYPTPSIDTYLRGRWNAGVENATLELNGPMRRGGKCRNDEMQTLNSTSVWYKTAWQWKIRIRSNNQTKHTTMKCP